MDETEKILEGLKQRVDKLYASDEQMSQIEYEIINTLAVLISVVKDWRSKLINS